MNTKKDDSSKASTSSEEKQGHTLQVIVRRVGKPENESLELSMDMDASVLDLKQIIEKELNKDGKEDNVVPVNRQRLIFSGKLLRDDAQRLKDADMNAGKKHFVHLSPLPKGVTSSTRTARELSVQAPATVENNAQQRARRVGPQSRRRRRAENPSGSGAYHPYAFAVPSRLQSSMDGLRSDRAFSEEAQVPAQFSAAESILASERAAFASNLTETDLNWLCSLTQPSGNSSVASLLQLQNLQQHDAALLSNPLVLETLRSAATSDLLSSRLINPQGISSFAGTSAGVGIQASQRDLADLLDRIAQNAGELATTLRLLSPPATPGPMYSSPTTFYGGNIVNPRSSNMSQGERFHPSLSSMQSMGDRLNASAGNSSSSPYASIDESGNRNAGPSGYFPF